MARIPTRSEVAATEACDFAGKRGPEDRRASPWCERRTWPATEPGPGQSAWPRPGPDPQDPPLPENGDPGSPRRRPGGAAPPPPWPIMWSIEKEGLCPAPAPSTRVRLEAWAQECGACRGRAQGRG